MSVRKEKSKFTVTEENVDMKNADDEDTAEKKKDDVKNRCAEELEEVKEKSINVMMKTESDQLICDFTTLKDSESVQN